MNKKLLGFVASLMLMLTTSLHANEDLVVSGVPDESPITIKATASATELVVDLRLEPEWHVYSRDVGGGQPIAISTEPGSAMVATGDLRLPQSSSGKLTEAVQIRLPIGLGFESKSRRLDATLRVQVCDALMCLPPMEIKLSGQAPSIKVLLVVGANDERTTRINEWLQGRGFQTTIQTYEEVSSGECDAHDVVLADSHVFGKTNASRADVRNFPKSNTPIVAVGFNGTELVEAHRVAMTSGYI